MKFLLIPLLILTGCSHLKQAHTTTANRNPAAVKDCQTSFTKSEEVRADKDYRGKGLTQFEVKGLSFYKANFEGASLINLNLSHKSFVGTNFKNADLSGANLQGALLINANLEGAKLSEASLIGAEYNSRTIFPEGFNPKDHGMIDMDNPLPPASRNLGPRDGEIGKSKNYKDRNLSQYQIEGLDFYKANFEGASLRGLNLRYKNFAEANFKNANLRGANLKGAVLSKANFEGAKLEGAKYDSSTIFPEGFNPKDHGMLDRGNRKPPGDMDLL